MYLKRWDSQQKSLKFKFRPDALSHLSDGNESINNSENIKCWQEHRAQGGRSSKVQAHESTRRSPITLGHAPQPESPPPTCKKTPQCQPPLQSVQHHRQAGATWETKKDSNSVPPETHLPWAPEGQGLTWWPNQDTAAVVPIKEPDYTTHTEMTRRQS